jgi:ABC-2 type transport system permease protein
MRWGAVAAIVAVLLGVSGCGSSGITGDRLNGAVAPTFANLYVLQQSLRGRKIAAASLNSRADCTRGDASTADSGAGNDWTCTVTWFNTGPNIAVTASYQVHVQTNGCYTADGDGPADLNGQQMITAADGVTVTNPLWQFDGCFDTT